MISQQHDIAGIVINPFGESFVISREWMAALKTRKDVNQKGMAEITVEKPTTVRLGEPNVYPTEMVRAITSHLEKSPAVTRAWLRLMEKDGEPTALPVIWIAPHSGAYDFHSKYTKGATDYHCPAPFDEATTAYIQGVAKDTYKLLGLSGVARVDAILGEDAVAYVLEANTVPGMTATSLVPKAAAAVGISFPELCEKILLSAHK